MGRKKRSRRWLPENSPIALAMKAGSDAPLSEIAAQAAKFYGEEKGPPAFPSALPVPPLPSAGRPSGGAERRSLAVYLSAPAQRFAAADDELADARPDDPDRRETIRSAVFDSKG